MPSYCQPRGGTWADVDNAGRLSREAYGSSTESYETVDTSANSQIAWCSSSCSDVSSAVSPEVIGAVHLLSLKQATWALGGPPFRARDDTFCTDVGHDTCKEQAELLLSSTSNFPTGTPVPDPATPGRHEAPSDNSADTHVSLLPTPPKRHASIRFQPCSHKKQSNSFACADQAPASQTARRLQLQPCVAKVQPRGSRSKDPASIKEWAALTTWLRMNLHQARTAKRQVCFIGQQCNNLDRWVFELNPRLSWEEVSKETKHRLRLLPKEAELAFTHKYPHKHSEAWKEKQVKYKPANSGDGFDIALGPLVYDLHKVYLLHEVHSRRSRANMI